MARFFDPNSRGDELLLHTSVLDHAALERVATQAERDVFREFTERDAYTDALEVKLTDYDADPTACDADLLQALKEVIANVVSHRLRFYDTNDRVTSESLGAYSVSYAGDGVGDTQWPLGWDAPLTLWDERTPNYFA